MERGDYRAHLHWTDGVAGRQLRGQRRRGSTTPPACHSATSCQRASRLFPLSAPYQVSSWFAACSVRLWAHSHAGAVSFTLPGVLLFALSSSLFSDVSMHRWGNVVILFCVTQKLPGVISSKLSSFLVPVLTPQCHYWVWKFPTGTEIERVSLSPAFREYILWGFAITDPAVNSVQKQLECNLMCHRMRIGEQSHEKRQ